ncbi:MAG: type II toxin-antitoxin system Phd/YefM family antitoxin [Patescibacteria group bacterium]
MNIPLSQQVSATYARNNFKEVNEKAVKEGICIIVCKSKPATVLISIDEYLKLKNAKKTEQAKNKPRRKMTLAELRKDSFFEKYAGCMQDDYPGMTALDLQHNWYKYVD